MRWDAIWDYVIVLQSFVNGGFLLPSFLLFSFHLFSAGVGGTRLENSFWKVVNQVDDPNEMKGQ